MRWVAAGLLLVAALWARVRVYAMFRTRTSPAMILRFSYLGFSHSLHLPQLGRDTGRFVHWYEALSPQRRDALLAAAPRLLALARRIRLHTFSLRICTGDAAHAALWHGALHALGQTLCLSHPHCCTELRCQCSPQADFRIEGIVSLRLGQILLAALKFGIVYIKRRVPAWKSIPLRAL